MKCVLLPSWASDHDMLQVSFPTDGPKWGSGFWRLNTLLLEADAFKAAFTSFYPSVRALRPMYSSVVEWWEAAKCRFATFCRRFAVTARRRDRAGVARWMASLSYIQGRFNRGEHVDWALYEGAKERLRGLLEARAKVLAFQSRLKELEEGEKPSAYFFQAARARRGASAFEGLKRPDGTVAEGSAMLAVAEAYYAELFSRRACDPVVEAALLDCVSARLESEEAQSMEADVTLEEHGFLHGVLKRMGFGPRFISWVRTLYAGVYSCVRVNGFLSGPVEQLGGVRQGCPLSPLLYVLFMEPFAELVRRDPGVDGVRLPGASGRVLKIQQYADDTTLFVSSARSLGRIRALTDLFGAGTGSKVNLAKSSVLYCGRWRDDRSGGGFSVCTGGLKILGVRFFARNSAVLNWEARLNLVRTRLGVWTRRQLSLTGRVVVVRSVLLPLLIHLAYVFPVPARTKLALTRLVFRFLWGGGYEYVTREQMYMPVSGGGPGVPRIPLKLDVLHVCFASRIFLERVPHRCYYFARFYLAGFFRHLVALSHVVPRSETPSPVYGTAIRFLRQCPSPVTREEATDHRALYARLASRQVVTPSGVPAGVVWSRVCGGGAPGAVRDLQWRCALGRLPVREILHRHGCAASPLCPRGCGAPETVFHVFWDCPYAREFWTLVQGLLRRVGPGHVLSRDGVVYRRGLGFLPSVTSGVLWDLLGYAKLVLWEARTAVVGRRVRIMDPAQVYHRFRGRVAGRIRMDRVVHGREWELKRWGFLALIFL
ncbi:hypothetical protein AAFF_G00417310 [Aldrovandia affinis]|uniref:Reverse transcriptase domain-containing protein n=1 Tax=Aldrovandia affinis TaxID=143900 RepID=A0AAD7R3B4_9TELE|nr:hypothetical protein AAFF_G00417310 [Aldrovandia affinis]